MRVAQVYFEPRFSGIGRHVSDLAAYLTAADVDVDVVLPPGQEAEFQRRCPACHLWPLAMGRLERGDQLLQLRRLVKRVSPSLVHVHGPYSGLWARLALLGSGWRLVYTPHVLSLRQWHWRRLHWYWERWLARHTDAFVTVCDANRRLLIGRGGVLPDSVRVVRNGLSAAAWQMVSERLVMRRQIAQAAGIDEHGLWLGQVGRLDWQKGPDLTLAAWPDVAGRWPAVHLFFWGDGPMREELLAVWWQLSFRERVHFLGWRENAAAEIAALDLLLLPSRWEGFPYTLLEALSQEGPVLASTVGGVPELLPRDWLLLPGDASLLAMAISRQLGRLPLLRQAARRVKAQAARQFTLARQGASVLAFYRELRIGEGKADS